MKSKLLIIVLITTTHLFAQNTSIENIDLSKHFQQHKGTFVLLDLNKNNYKIYNDSISKKRYSPCSTFKVPNSLISLEVGIAENENFQIKWDSIKNPKEPWMKETEPFKYWMQDHSLKTAIKYSVVWYYQELARKIGKDNMQKYLEQINYGNNDISSGIDNFWLCGSIKISAIEQVDFLKKLYHESLNGFSRQNQQVVKKIMLYETNNNYKLYGKTGGGDCFNNKVIGWYIGFIETKRGSYAFALNIIVDNFNDLRPDLRVGLTKKLLKELKIL